MFNRSFLPPKADRQICRQDELVGRFDQCRTCESADEARQTLIRGARVYDRAGDVHRPPVRDVIVEGNRIASVTAPGELSDRKAEIAEGCEPTTSPGARSSKRAGMLLIPGLVNAHYHSYDVLAKGRFEDMPFDVWALHSQPAYWGKRSKAELRARTLLGAMECLRHGITTIQDMNSLVPQDEETLDIILAAYAEVGIRVVFSIAVRDIAALDIEPFLPAGMPAEVSAIVDRQARRCTGRPCIRRSAAQAARCLCLTAALGAQPVGTATLLDSAA